MGGIGRDARGRYVGSPWDGVCPSPGHGLAPARSRKTKKASRQERPCRPVWAATQRAGRIIRDRLDRPWQAQPSKVRRGRQHCCWSWPAATRAAGPVTSAHGADVPWERATINKHQTAKGRTHGKNWEKPFATHVVSVAASWLERVFLRSFGPQGHIPSGRTNAACEPSFLVSFPQAFRIPH